MELSVTQYSGIHPAIILDCRTIRTVGLSEIQYSEICPGKIPVSQDYGMRRKVGLSGTQYSEICPG